MISKIRSKSSSKQTKKAREKSYQKSDLSLRERERERELSRMQEEINTCGEQIRGRGVTVMHGHGGATIDLLGSAVPPPRLQSKQGANSKNVSTDWNDFSSTSSKVSSFSVPQTRQSEGEILQSINVKSFSFAELKTSTRNFCREIVLGEGRFGSVFEGWIDENTFAAAKPGTGIIIAVKRLNRESFQGHKEWLAEVNYLGQLSHPHITKLIGYCLEDDHRLLVYEFMPQGSLETHLFRRGSKIKPLSWSLRMKVARDAAKGLAFLHSAETKLIHRDFKTSVILLDSSYNAKLSDFGLAKDGPTGDETHISTRVVGTYGYTAPEYSTTGHLTKRCDVYSYGVVLLEILSGRRAFDWNRPSGEDNLVEWAKPYLANKRKIFRILDNCIEDQYTMDGAYKAATVALKCLSKDPKSRPTMDEVVTVLEQLQESETNCSEPGEGQPNFPLNCYQNSKKHL